MNALDIHKYYARRFHARTPRDKATIHSSDWRQSGRLRMSNNLIVPTTQRPLYSVIVHVFALTFLPKSDRGMLARHKISERVWPERGYKMRKEQNRRPIYPALSPHPTPAVLQERLGHHVSFACSRTAFLTLDEPDFPSFSPSPAR